MLLERDETLITLGSLVDEARAGRGRVALIRGEAGIGKTSVVKQFVADLDDAHVLWGGCDDLMAARPLGPLWDMSFDEPDLEEALESGERQTTFSTVFEVLSRALRPTVMVMDDVHWTDDATLDLIKFVGRRIERTHGLLILTYRDGEVAGDHPLRVALGDLYHEVVERVPLAPLSEEGVGELAAFLLVRAKGRILERRSKFQFEAIVTDSPGTRLRAAILKIYELDRVDPSHHGMERPADRDSVVVRVLRTVLDG